MLIIGLDKFCDQFKYFRKPYPNSMSSRTKKLVILTSRYGVLMAQSTKQYRCMLCHWLRCILGQFLVFVLSDGILFRIKDTPILYNPKNKPSPMLCCWLIDSSSVLKQRYHSDIAVKENLPYIHVGTWTSSRPTVCRPMWSTTSVVSRASLMEREKSYTHTYTHWPVHCPDHRHSNDNNSRKIKSKNWCNQNHTFCQLVSVGIVTPGEGLQMDVGEQSSIGHKFNK